MALEHSSWLQPPVLQAMMCGTQEETTSWLLVRRKNRSVEDLYCRHTVASSVLHDNRFNQRANDRWNDMAEVFHDRVLGAVLMAPVAALRPLGDWIMKRARGTARSQLIWDCAAFQVPIYAAIIAVNGAASAGLLSGIIGATVMMLVLGRPYGLFLNWVRHVSGLPRGGTKPMSLNT